MSCYRIAGALILALTTCVQVLHATQTSVSFIRADQVHAQGITGRGVTVAVLDQGVSYSVLGANDIAAGGASFVPGNEPIGDGGAAPPGLTHGDVVSLIITDPTGVAPNAKILPVRVFDATGQTDWPYLRMAIRYVANRRNSDPTIRVINLSLGAGSYSCLCDNNDDGMRAIAAAMNDTHDKGILSVVATGNEANCEGIYAPACLSRALPVVANYDTAQTGVIQYENCNDIAPPEYYVTCFSNLVDNCAFLVAAPGYDIYVGGFGPEFGTSFAAPHVSGVAALMFEKNACGGLDANTARTLIHWTASEYVFGYPHCETEPFPKQLNALAAVNAVVAGECPMLGDLNCDGTIDARDLGHMLHCVKGPNGQAPVGFCGCGNFPPAKYRDGDDAVDMRDFAQFQLAFTGYG